jgi:hypothetical protein
VLGNNHSDIFFYLIQSLQYNGLNLGYDSIVNSLSPLIPFLTSLLFKLGFVSEASLFIISGIFYIIAILGIYKLLSLKFNPLLSTFGAMVYASFGINLTWVGLGIDIPSVSLSIWAVYFAILAIEKNQKYFYIAFPIAILSFLAKYTAGLIIPLIFIYFLSKPHIIYYLHKYLKHLIGGLIFGLLFLIPSSGSFFKQLSEISYEKQNFFFDLPNDLTFIQKLFNIPEIIFNNFHYKFFYLIRLPFFIGNSKEKFPQIVLELLFSFFILLLFIYAVIILMKKLFLILKQRNLNSYNILDENKFYIILLIISIITIFSTFFLLNMLPIIYTQLVLFLSFILLIFSSNKLNISKNNNFNYILTMFYWFISYFDFFSAHMDKANRYFIPMVPSFTFFVVLGMYFLLKKNFKPIGFNINNKRILGLSIVLCILFAFGQLGIPKDDYQFANDAVNISLWIKEYDPNYYNKVIYSNRGEIFTWYLKKDIPVPRKKLPSYNDLALNNCTYIIESNHNFGIENNEYLQKYHQIKRTSYFSIYEKNL